MLSKNWFALLHQPNASGSSFGVTKVKTAEQIQPALEKAFAESDDVMIELSWMVSNLPTDVIRQKINR